MNGTPIPVLVLFGATACGKTALADRLFSADADSPFAGMAEVISADSMQVYRGMDIGTAKPDASLRQRLDFWTRQDSADNGRNCILYKKFYLRFAADTRS